MIKMRKKRIAILALGCLLAIGAGATAYFIRLARSEKTASTSTGVLMMAFVAALVLVAASAGRRRREQRKRNEKANKAEMATPRKPSD